MSGGKALQPQYADRDSELQAAYERAGASDRKEYLAGLAEDNGLDEDTVFMMADMLGPNEDFDGLVTELQDMAGDF